MNEREVSDHKLDTELRTRAAVGYTRYIPAPMLLMSPIDGVIQHGEILGVWLHLGEDVIWTWFNDRVIGYEIVKHSQELG